MHKPFTYNVRACVYAVVLSCLVLRTISKNEPDSPTLEPDDRCAMEVWGCFQQISTLDSSIEANHVVICESITTALDCYYARFKSDCIFHDSPEWALNEALSWQALNCVGPTREPTLSPSFEFGSNDGSGRTCRTLALLD